VDFIKVRAERKRAYYSRIEMDNIMGLPFHEDAENVGRWVEYRPKRFLFLSIDWHNRSNSSLRLILAFGPVGKPKRSHSILGLRGGMKGPS
jgi:hypothetical protein